MNMESLLENKLRQFSILEFALVKSVYFFLSVLIYSLYTPLSGIGWLFYALLFLICSFPLWLHLCAQKGSLKEKILAYLKTNGPANQVLFCLSTFFCTLMLCVLLPFLSSFNPWFYVIIALVLSIKPLTVTWFW